MKLYSALEETFSVVHEKPELVHVDLGKDGASHGNIVVDFGGIDSLAVAGNSVYALSAGEMVVDAPQVRAITGGTSRFIGARGQITTTRRDAGHDDHKIKLVD